ncbi:MAG: PaREP1 family protein [Candidatus Micrarchaeia archaeon]
MAESREDLVRWALEKAEEYLLSAKKNLEEDRLFVAAEEIFRAIENSLEAMLYEEGIKKITYPGKEREFSGRLALQFLVRDNLLRKKILSEAEYNEYLACAAKLHQAGYRYGSFDEKELEHALEYAEDLFHKALSRK